MFKEYIEIKKAPIGTIVRLLPDQPQLEGRKAVVLSDIIKTNHFLTYKKIRYLDNNQIAFVQDFEEVNILIGENDANSRNQMV